MFGAGNTEGARKRIPNPVTSSRKLRRCDGVGEERTPNLRTEALGGTGGKTPGDVSSLTVAREVTGLKETWREVAVRLRGMSQGVLRPGFKGEAGPGPPGPGGGFGG